MHVRYPAPNICMVIEATSHIDQLAAPYPFQLECFRRWYYYNAARTNATAKPNGCMIKFAHCDGRSIKPRSCQNRYLQFATEMGWYVLSLISFTISKSPLHLSDLARIASYKSTSSQKKKKKTSLADQVSRFCTEHSVPPAGLATLIASQHLRPFQPLPMIFPPALLFCSYLNLSGFETEAAGINAAWSGLYLILARRRKQVIQHDWKRVFVFDLPILSSIFAPIFMVQNTRWQIS